MSTLSGCGNTAVSCAVETKLMLAPRHKTLAPQNYFMFMTPERASKEFQGRGAGNPGRCVRVVGNYSCGWCSGVRFECSHPCFCCTGRVLTRLGLPPPPRAGLQDEVRTRLLSQVAANIKNSWKAPGTAPGRAMYTRHLAVSSSRYYCFATEKCQRHEASNI